MVKAEWLFPAETWQRPTAADVLPFPMDRVNQRSRGLAGGCQVIPLRTTQASRWGATDAGQ